MEGMISNSFAAFTALNNREQEILTDICADEISDKQLESKIVRNNVLTVQEEVEAKKYHKYSKEERLLVKENPLAISPKGFFFEKISPRMNLVDEDNRILRI